MTKEQELTALELTNEMIDILSFGKRSKETISTYKTYAVPFLEYCFDQLQVDPSKATEKDARAYLSFIQEKRGLSDRTVNLANSSVHFLCSAVLGLPWNSLKVPFRSFDEYIPFVPSEKEMEAFLQGIRKPKLKAILMVMYACGLRVSEACSLRFRDVDRKQMLLHIAPSKRGKERYVELPEKAFLQMDGYWKVCHDHETRCSLTKESWIFPRQRSLEAPIYTNYVHTNIPAVEEALGWEHRFVSHSFRRAFATHNFLNGNMALEEIQLALGHSSPSTTRIYIRGGVAALQHHHRNAIDTMEL